MKGIILDSIDALNDVDVERLDARGRIIGDNDGDENVTVSFRVSEGGGGKSKLISPFTVNDAIVSVLTSPVGSTNNNSNDDTKTAALSAISFLTDIVCKGKKKTKSNKTKFSPTIILEDLMVKLLEGIHDTTATCDNSDGSNNNSNNSSSSGLAGR